MCCFSRPVQAVSATNIFARPGENGRQLLAYSMTLRAKEDLAMILPLPAGSGEQAVTFINLNHYAGFFTDLRSGFPLPVAEAESLTTRSAHIELEVIQVGDFEASYVPTVADFSRLDERFRLPPETWDTLLRRV